MSLGHRNKENTGPHTHIHTNKYTQAFPHTHTYIYICIWKYLYVFVSVYVCVWSSVLFVSMTKIHTRYSESRLSRPAIAALTHSKTVCSSSIFHRLAFGSHYFPVTRVKLNLPFPSSKHSVFRLDNCNLFTA